ncbi:unnamed protein product [Ceutorhynchus assimilis]|uniref:acid phosphatase n=1 Tax=Ceutorhynchus assimilis TaxID=467358 RepID=A0A9N9MXF4_9CUCU|nr:unnamed protein product [Ceutorhynchus assimilis]
MNKKEMCLIGYFIIFFVFCWSVYFAVFFTSSPTQNSTTLELVHVIMRHGDRNPDKVSIGLLSPYLDEKYYAEGYGQLHKAGIIRAHQVGSYLRSRYNNFLGPTWNIKHLEARTSDYNRTKMSLQLALAGLYPPVGSQMWSSIYWQPIPYNYVPKFEDKELLPYNTCPRFNELLNDIYEEPNNKKYLERYNETFSILENKTLRKMDPESAFYLYIGFQIQEQLGYPLEEWTKAVYPEPLHAEMIDFYHLITNTTEIRRIIAGYFLKKLLTDTKAKINGTIEPPERKMFFYSAHEVNIAAMLLTLNEAIFELPPYSAFIIFEVHKIEGVYGIKMFYQNYKQADPVLLKIKGCDYFCPFDELYRVVEKYLPEGDEECFGGARVS